MWKEITRIILIILFFNISIFAREVTLTWEPNIEPGIYCYTVYWGTASRTYTETSEDILHSTCSETECSTTVEIPDDDQIYYFSATTWNMDSVHMNIHLAIGTSSPNISYSAFNYALNLVEHNISEGEISPGNDVIPQGLYGAIALDIGVDETIHIIEAVDNVTGYDTAELARYGLPEISEDHIRLGTVTVVKSDGDFIFGTTGLDDVYSEVIYNDNPAFYFIAKKGVESDYSNEVNTRKMVGFTIKIPGSIPGRNAVTTPGSTPGRMGVITH